MSEKLRRVLIQTETGSYFETRVFDAETGDRLRGVIGILNGILTEFTAEFKVVLEYEGNPHTYEKAILVTIPSHQAILRGVKAKREEDCWTPYIRPEERYDPVACTTKDSQGDVITDQTRIENCVARYHTEFGGVTVQRSRECPECFGTGFWRGFGAPCSKRCKA